MKHTSLKAAIHQITLLLSFYRGPPSKPTGHPIRCTVSKISNGSILHEIGHALGLHHEHQRPDRDDFVIIDPSVKKDKDYKVIPEGRKFGAYDCKSVMHYGKIPGKISSKGSACAGMGQRKILTMGDIAAAAAIPTFPFDTICGMIRSKSGNGYLLVETRGGVVYFGDALFCGSRGGQHLDTPVCGIAPTPSGNGYWLVAEDGGVFSFGDAQFFDSAIDSTRP
ncbi:M12 family metallopeptidase [Priestia megaterium]|uniref:M12 family metallopeptidase n=1 Tax=Priestia megaterium TaxID=1404 RepID=UPI002FFEB4BF